MTTPDTKMLSAERLANIRAWVKADCDASVGRPVPKTGAMRELLGHIDALTARAAELEQEKQRETNLAIERGVLINRLVAELAAARAPVEDGEIADIIGWLGDTAEGLFSPDAHYGAQLTKAANLITRLARERDEARGKALEEASNIVAGASVAVNYLPDLKTPNDLAAYLTRRDLKLAEEIRALKSVKGE